jgi:hypothetical protein
MLVLVESDYPYPLGFVEERGRAYFVVVVVSCCR